MIEEQKVKAVVDAYVHANKWQSLAEELADVLLQLQESAHYWSEYDVPIGIVDKIDEALSRYKAATHV